jgi:hypothetical protein
MKRSPGCLSLLIVFIFFLFLPFLLFVDQPPLNIVHPVLKRADMPNCPFLQLFEPLGNSEEGTRNV